MAVTIGIRREDKNEWERRAPLIPPDIAFLRKEHGLRFVVQFSPIRAYFDAEYESAGAELSEDLAPAGIVLAVKEIPIDLLRARTTYVFFAHVIKGQPHNMPLLASLLERDCSLVDYERIIDDRGRRLIFFGRHAGLAGMIETLWGFGQRLRALGVVTPFAELRHAYEYADFGAAQAHIGELGGKIRREGLPAELQPRVFGLVGYGNVTKGAQEILACLPVTEVSVAELPALAASRSGGLVQVVFKEQDMVRPRKPGAVFELQDYYDHPGGYEGCFDEHLAHLDVLVNTIYWDERYPRLVTREWARR